LALLKKLPALALKKQLPSVKDSGGVAASPYPELLCFGTRATQPELLCFGTSGTRALPWAFRIILRLRCNCLVHPSRILLQ